jgi:hypothetical protein
VAPISEGIAPITAGIALEALAITAEAGSPPIAVVAVFATAVAAANFKALVSDDI